MAPTLAPTANWYTRVTGTSLTAVVDEFQVHSGRGLARVAERRRVSLQPAVPFAVAHVHHGLRSVAHQARCKQTITNCISAALRSRYTGACVVDSKHCRNGFLEFITEKNPANGTNPNETAENRWNNSFDLPDTRRYRGYSSNIFYRWPSVTT